MTLPQGYELIGRSFSISRLKDWKGAHLRLLGQISAGEIFPVAFAFDGQRWEPPVKWWTKLAETDEARLIWVLENSRFLQRLPKGVSRSWIIAVQVQSDAERPPTLPEESKPTPSGLTLGETRVWSAITALWGGTPPPMRVKERDKQINGWIKDNMGNQSQLDPRSIRTAIRKIYPTKKSGS